MTAQKGQDLLLKIDSDGNGKFISVAGLRTRALSFNAQAVDVTTAESPNAWRELLQGASPRSASVSGRGIFRDQDSDEIIRAAFFAGEIKKFQIVIPGFGTMQGLFQITSLEFAGEYDGEVNFEIALESAGQLTFTAEAQSDVQ